MYSAMACFKKMQFVIKNVYLKKKKKQQKKNKYVAVTIQHHIVVIEIKLCNQDPYSPL